MPSRVFDPLPITVFTLMSRLAVEHGAINLGQGYPDEDGPAAIREHAARGLLEGPNQYPPMRGTTGLREAVAAANRRFYDIGLDPEREVLVTSGATEALAASLLGLLNPADEAIVFEPAYDSYAPIIALAGAKAVPVRLAPPGFVLDEAALAAAFSARTKLIVLNTPMNPSGKVFDARELDLIARLCQTHDVLAVCDEVYEHIVFPGASHRPLMSLKGMEERTVRIGSAGKTFSLTGWKVGYVSGPARLIDVIAKAHQFLTFTTPPALQDAVAFGLALPDRYFAGLARDLAAKRDLLAQGLAGLGFDVLPAQGTYFLIASYAPLGLAGTADEVAKMLTIEAKVASIPLDAFYTDGAQRPYLRFCFSKRREVLEDAVSRLGTYLAAR
jgi:aspartate/methionine/tyrosine aminotransferase